MGLAVDDKLREGEAFGGIAEATEVIVGFAEAPAPTVLPGNEEIGVADAAADATLEEHGILFASTEAGLTPVLTAFDAPSETTTGEETAAAESVGGAEAEAAGFTSEATTAAEGSATAAADGEDDATAAEVKPLPALERDWQVEKTARRKSL